MEELNHGFKYGKCDQKTACGALLADLDVPTPQDKAEQEAIGGFFSYLDNLIALHQSECEKWKVLKKGLLQQMFV